MWLFLFPCLGPFAKDARDASARANRGGQDCPPRGGLQATVNCSNDPPPSLAAVGRCDAGELQKALTKGPTGVVSVTNFVQPPRPSSERSPSANSPKGFLFVTQRLASLNTRFEVAPWVISCRTVNRWPTDAAEGATTRGRAQQNGRGRRIAPRQKRGLDRELPFAEASGRVRMRKGRLTPVASKRRTENPEPGGNCSCTS